MPVGEHNILVLPRALATHATSLGCAYAEQQFTFVTQEIAERIAIFDTTFERVLLCYALIIQTMYLKTFTCKITIFHDITNVLNYYIQGIMINEIILGYIRLRGHY